MKNYNEVAERVFARRERFFQERRERRRKLRLLLMPVGCVLLILLTGVLLPQPKQPAASLPELPQVTSPMTDIESKEFEEQPYVCIRIHQWYKDGFVGVVMKTEGLQLFPEGTVLTVYLDENMIFQKQVPGGARFIQRRPGVWELPPGSVVVAQYYASDRANGILWCNGIIG